MACSRLRVVLAMVAVTVVALATSAGATPITIPNAGFEDRVHHFLVDIDDLIHLLAEIDHDPAAVGLGGRAGIDGEEVRTAVRARKEIRCEAGFALFDDKVQVVEQPEP